MSAAQEKVLLSLGRGSHTAVGVAQACDMTIGATHRCLDALFRRSLVTITPQQKWCLTERGRKRVAA